MGEIPDEAVVLRATVRTGGAAGRDLDGYLRYPVPSPNRDDSRPSTGDPDFGWVAVPLPSSPDLKQWLYADPIDADDYLLQLDTFLDEQMLTGATIWALQQRIGSRTYFVLAPYGFRYADESRHLAALAASGLQ